MQLQAPPVQPLEQMRGVAVGVPSVSLEEMWRQTPKRNGRI
jgi:hypothetical protein